MTCAPHSTAASTTPMATTPIFRSARSPCPKHIFNVLEQSASIDQLVVIGTSSPDLTSELLSRRAAKILRKSNCSVIIAHGDVSEYHEQLVRVMTRESKCRVLPMITRFW